MQFERHVRDWNEMAADPFWAVLTGKRDWDLQEFFATGDEDAGSLFARTQQLGLPRDRLRALDFGCGVGRVTRRLAEQFVETVGVDVSRPMLELARRYNPECLFHLSRRDDLGDFPDSHFDLVYSLIVLQHQPTSMAIENYLREFVRVLRPGGLLAFQLPSSMPLRYRLAPRRRAYRLLHAAGIGAHRLLQWKLFPMKMTAMKAGRVSHVIERSGGRVLHSEAHTGSGPIPSRMYYCTKDGE
ncbi:MAG TPA: class I SAM-dependent methyltransferase [Candidatus Angelobacter sp.]|nr:class I SAM-dependent methyltransferase [Candidatus Angelobacter sp.]